MRSEKVQTSRYLLASASSRRVGLADKLPRRRVGLLLVALMCAVTAVGAVLPASAIASSSLAAKRAQASKIASQVQQLDAQLAAIQEKLNAHKVDLQATNAKISQANAALARERAAYLVARDRLVARLVALYEHGGSDTALVRLVHAQSLSKFLDASNDVNIVSHADARIVGQVRRLRKQMHHDRTQLKKVQKQQSRQVRGLANTTRAFTRKTQARQQVLDSVNAEIRSMVEAQERAAEARQAAASKALAAQIAAAQQSAAAASNTTAPTTSAPTVPSVLDDTPSPSGGDTDVSAVLATPTPPPPSSVAASAASVAMSYIGVPYVYGGESPSGFDCSGLVAYAFGKVGRSLPHSSYALWNAGPHVSRSDLAVGDLVFFDGLGHVGIYVGGGSFVHAPHTGTTVQVASLSSEGSYVGAVRVS